MSDTHRQHRRLAAVAEPTIRPARAEDRDLLAGFLTRLSPESAYARFLVGMGGRPAPRILDGLLPQRPRGAALLAFLGEELVGHGLWVRLADPKVAELALVVGDRHQRRGIGTALAGALTADLVTEGVTHLAAVSSAENRAVARMVARAAPDARRELDGPTSTWRFPAHTPVEAPAAALPRTA